MNYLSVCSGIEAATTAWHSLGWRPVGFSEVDRFPSAVLAHHYPDVPNFGDMTRYREWDLANVDLLVGGTPCQSFSVAGLRAGLDDPRGNLALTFLGIVDRFRPRWVVWENVPGVLSSSGGRDFGAFLGGLGQLGYGWAYRVLDAQYVRVDSHPRAVPQRRRRVFVVGCAGGLANRAAAVLFERESLSGHPAPRREAGKGFAGGVAGGVGGGQVAPTLDATHNRKWGSHQWVNNGFAVVQPVSHCLNAGGMGRIDYETETMVVFDPTQVTSKANRSNPQPGDPCHTLARGMAPPVVFGWQNSPSQGLSDSTEVSPSLDKSKTPVAFGVDGASGTLRANPGSGFRSDGSAVEAVVSIGTAVRRLTPTECERLQGFPDGYTAVPVTRHRRSCALILSDEWDATCDCDGRVRPAADGPRYKALGNSMAVNVMRWIGQRIEMVERGTDAG